MGEPLTLTTALEPRGPAAAVVLTDEQVVTLGAGKKAFPVTISVGGVTVAARLARMGGENLIGLSKATRSELGVAIGDTVEVTIKIDEAPREVEVPSDLAEALAANPKAKAAFDSLAFTYRKEHARAVAEAKKQETRNRRIATIIASLVSS